MVKIQRNGNTTGGRGVAGGKAQRCPSRLISEASLYSATRAKVRGLTVPAGCRWLLASQCLGLQVRELETGETGVKVRQGSGREQ